MTFVSRREAGKHRDSVFTETDADADAETETETETAPEIKVESIP